MRRLLVLIAACSPADPAPPVESPPAPAPRRVSAPADSTVAARDYIGPAACGECHAPEHALWSQSLHAVMNQRAAPAAVIAPFDRTLAYRDGTVELAREGNDFTMTLVRGDARVRYRVTRTIGKRGLQEYVGVGPAGIEVRLPFGYWPRRGGWYPQPYFDPWLTEDTFDAFAEVREPWAERCPWCHSTYPFAQRIARSTAKNVGHGLEESFDLPGGTTRLALDQQVTVGISCESCHLGGRAHAVGSPIHFVPIGPDARPGAPAPTTFAAERRDPAIVNRVCAQCHSGPSPRFADGTATRNSSEAIDLAASTCTTARCVDCHEPHRADARAADGEARAIAACTRCHERLADPQLARMHARHTGATCLDCHMPRVVLGIDRFVRTHRISSPGDPAVFATAPNACNLCHLDRSLAWTAAALGNHGRMITSKSTAPAGERWLASPEPAIRLIAADAYARGTLGRAALPSIVRLLDDPLPYVRAWAVFSVEDILGRTPEYDPRLPAAARRAQIAKLLEVR